jgi:hypothetical protein
MMRSKAIGDYFNINWDIIYLDQAANYVGFSGK